MVAITVRQGGSHSRRSGARRRCRLIERVSKRARARPALFRLLGKRAIDDNSGSKVFYGWLPARTVVDAVASYTTKSITYQLNVDNLLNKKYIYASRSSLVQVPGTPTNVRFSVTYRFE